MADFLGAAHCGRTHAARDRNRRATAPRSTAHVAQPAAPLPDPSRQEAIKFTPGSPKAIISRSDSGTYLVNGTACICLRVPCVCGCAIPATASWINADGSTDVNHAEYLEILRQDASRDQQF